MPSGFINRSKGKIQATELWLGTGGGAGGIVDSVSGIAAFPVVCQQISLPVTAVANTDFQISIPAGFTVLRASVYTLTAYTGTTVTIQCGSTLGGVDFVAAVTIKAAGWKALTLIPAAGVTLGSMPSTLPNFFARIVQTGATNVGNALLVVEYT